MIRCNGCMASIDFYPLDARDTRGTLFVLVVVNFIWHVIGFSLVNTNRIDLFLMLYLQSKSREAA